MDERKVNLEQELVVKQQELAHWQQELQKLEGHRVEITKLIIKLQGAVELLDSLVKIEKGPEGEIAKPEDPAPEEPPKEENADEQIQ